ncbi:hypothetical protein BaRGS_00018513 [Batillaria attramentaria]|uniref:Uncharacterized protein n=1 Tax=Batillaria attramentaria TaxID=370345 RepID=A0ABD0KT40_9CAEN
MVEVGEGRFVWMSSVKMARVGASLPCPVNLVPGSGSARDIAANNVLAGSLARGSSRGEGSAHDSSVVLLAADLLSNGIQNLQLTVNHNFLETTSVVQRMYMAVHIRTPAFHALLHVPRVFSLQC